MRSRNRRLRSNPGLPQTRIARNSASLWMGTDNEAVLVLHHYVGLPLVEVAELLDIPAGTARSRLHYAIAEPRDALTAVPEPPAREGRLA